MNFHILTIFPQIFDSYINESIIKRARKKELVNIVPHDLRDYTEDKHKTVDDVPFGGGAGMVMMVEPIFKALKNIKKKISSDDELQVPDVSEKIDSKPHIILLSAKGKTYDQKKTRELSKKKNIILVCGRYEGIDQRVQDNLVDETISIGNYVLTGGELPALAIIDSVTRLLPGVLGNKESIEEESFSKENNIEYPQYTRPADFNGWKVPEILLSGNHQKIKKWREKNSKNQ